MVRKIVVILSALMLVCVSASALAKGKPSKADVYHCGCVNYDVPDVPYATVFLEWNLLSVSKNSKGHRRHLDGDLEICTYFDGVEDQEVEYTRVDDDCQPEETPELLNGVEICTLTPEDGAPCYDLF